VNVLGVEGGKGVEGWGKGNCSWCLDVIIMIFGAGEL